MYFPLQQWRQQLFGPESKTWNQEKRRQTRSKLFFPFLELRAQQQRTASRCSRPKSLYRMYTVWCTGIIGCHSRLNDLWARLIYILYCLYIYTVSILYFSSSFSLSLYSWHLVQSSGIGSVRFSFLPRTSRLYGGTRHFQFKIQRSGVLFFKPLSSTSLCVCVCAFPFLLLWFSLYRPQVSFPQHQKE